MIYGYAPVSTDGQSVEAQVHQLRAADAAIVFREAASDPPPTRGLTERLAVASLTSASAAETFSLSATKSTAGTGAASPCAPYCDDSSTENLLRCRRNRRLQH